MSPTILVTGGEGQLGSALRDHLWPEGVTLIAPDRSALDLSDAGAIRGFVVENRVHAIVNAAAFTDVDGAEAAPDKAFAANEAVPAALAEAAREADAPLVHVSTDYVFDGCATTPYETDAPTAPLGVYGASKAAGERAVIAGAPRSVVVRTSWLVSARRRNFLTTMLRLAGDRDEIAVVDDNRGRPTLAPDLAAALAAVTLAMIADRGAPSGLFHFANVGETSWRGFADAIFAEASAQGVATPAVRAIRTMDRKTPARRPAYSTLSTRRIETEYGVAPRPWLDGLDAIVRDVLERAR